MRSSKSVLLRGPPPTKKRKNGTPEASTNGTCFLCNHICDEKHNYTESQWEKLKSTAEAWSGLDKYGHVFAQIDWTKGPQSIFHRRCVTNMQTSKKLDQAKNRQEKQNTLNTNTITTNIDLDESNDTTLSPTLSSPQLSGESSVRKSTRASMGVIFDKNLCIWCRKPDANITRRKGKAENPWSRVEQKKAWRRICACTPFLEDPAMRDRLLAIVAMFPKEDCFFADLHYHKKCWDKYVSNVQNTRKKCREHVVGVSMSEVNAVFIDHVERVICQLKEPRTLKGLLDDYNNILYDLTGEEKQYKTSYIRNFISDEFGNQILFHDRHQKNASTFVFDSSEGGNFLESTVNSWGLPIDELMHNVARRVNESVKGIPQMPWPPSMNTVITETPENFLTQFVGWLITPEKKETELSPQVYAIASLLHSPFLCLSKYTFLKKCC